MKQNAFSDELKMEVVVGAFMVMVFLGLGYFTIILSREAWFGPKFAREVVFQEVMGLREGDNVVVRGMPVGKIKSLKLAQDGVHVIANMDQEVAIHEGYKISIVSTSVLGGRYMQVDEGPHENQVVPAKTVLVGQRPVDLMADAAEVINELKKGLTTGGVISNVQNIASQLSQVSDRLNSGKGTLGRLLSEDDTLYNDLSSVAASLKQVATDMQNGKGTVGKLMTDETLYDEVKKAVSEVRSTIDDYRETAPVVTFTSIFFGAL